jgi:hypothetical protein
MANFSNLHSPITMTQQDQSVFPRSPQQLATRTEPENQKQLKFTLVLHIS